MMFKNIFRIQKKESSDHIIIRKTRFILYLIILLMCLLLAIQVSLIFWIIRSPISYDFWNRTLNNFFIISSVLLFVFMWYFLISRLINYFYSIFILTPQKIINITFWVNFIEKIKTIELNRIISVTSSQKWLTETLCNYWTITLRNANDLDITFKKIPRPKHVSNLIQKMQKAGNK